MIVLDQPIAFLCLQREAQFEYHHQEKRTHISVFWWSLAGCHILENKVEVITALNERGKCVSYATNQQSRLQIVEPTKNILLTPDLPKCSADQIQFDVTNSQ